MAVAFGRIFGGLEGPRPAAAVSAEGAAQSGAHHSVLSAFKASAGSRSTGHDVSSSLPLDVVIPAAAKDSETLPYAVEGVRRNLRHPIGTIFVIGESDAALHDVVQRIGARFVPENDLLSLQRTDLKYSVDGVDRSGWLFQKFLKFSGEALTDKSRYFVIDSDTVLIRPQVFELDGRPVLLHADEHHETYFQVCESLLGHPRATELSCVSHMVLYDVARLRALKAHIENRFRCPWFEAIIRNTRMNEASGCSDYELYGQWCLSQYPLETTCEYFSNTHLGRDRLRPVADLERDYGATYRSLSFHSYVPRECVPPWIAEPAEDQAGKMLTVAGRLAISGVALGKLQGRLQLMKMEEKDVPRLFKLHHHLLASLVLLFKAKGIEQGLQWRLIQAVRHAQSEARSTAQNAGTRPPAERIAMLAGKSIPADHPGFHFTS